MIYIYNEEMKDMHQYLRELDKRVKRAMESIAPRIGIFWLHLKDGKVKVFYSIVETLDFGEDYGDFVVSKQGHYSIWESLKRNDIVPKNSSYTDLPRGRVAFNKEQKQYVVYYGKWINAMPGIKSVIKSEFKLPSNVKWEADLHYHAIKRWGF